MRTEDGGIVGDMAKFLPGNVNSKHLHAFNSGIFYD